VLRSAVTLVLIALVALDFAYKIPYNNATSLDLPPVHHYLYQHKTDDNYSCLYMSINKGGLDFKLPYSYIFYQRIHRIPLMSANQADQM
jgi:hypothetical protein